MTIAARLTDVRARIDAAAREVGREPDEIGLIAVSKTKPLADVDAAAVTGQVDFGESYAQELRDKAGVRPDLRWHFIGRLQRNKAKYVAPVAYRVHALDNLRVARALVSRAPNGLSALVAVNVGREEQKGGVRPSELPAFLDEVAVIPGLTVCGLMCIPPWREDPEEVGPFFEELADLAARGRARGLGLTELSMGMSHDAHVAVRHGATWVRVGTAIFGARE